MNSNNEPRDDRSDSLRSQESLDDELLSAYVDGELTGPELARVESRLRQDAEARRWAAELRTLSRLVKSLPLGRPDPGLREQVLRRVNERRPASETKQPVNLAPSLAGESYGSLRRWLWSGLAIAAVLLLMFLQPGQPEAEKHVADAQPGPVRSGSVRSGSVRSGSVRSGPAWSGPAKEKRVIHEPAKEKGESERMGRMMDHGREADSGSLTASPSAAGRGEQGTSMGKSSARKLPANPVPSVASARVSEDLLTSGAKATRENSPESWGLARKAGDQPPAQAGVRGRSEFMRAARPTRSKQAASSRTEPDLVVQMLLHDPRRGGQWFRQLLTEHGMKPLEESDSSQVADALSKGTEEEGPRWQAARGRPQVTYPGELMETVIVETLPEQLRGLLQACRTDSESHVTVGRMAPDGTSQPERLSRNAPGEAGTGDKNRHDKQRADVGQQRSSLWDAARTPQMPVRVRFELRATVPDEESGEAPDNTRSPRQVAPPS